jgi:hypothetical protein
MVRITLTTRTPGYKVHERSDDPVKVPAVMGLNEEDRRNARRVLDRHQPATDRPGGGLMTCEACGQPYPCLPRQIAENTLADNSEQA